MIQKNSYLTPIDKNGVWKVKTFHLYKGFKRKTSSISNFIKVSARVTKPNNWISKKSKHISIITHTKKFISKNDGSLIFLKYNTNVLLKKRLSSKGREIIGPGVFNLKRKRFLSSFIKIIYYV